MQTHSLVQKTDDNGDIHKGYCTDAVYAGSMDAAGEKLCEKLTDNLPLSPALVSIYMDSKYPDSAIASKRQPVIGIAYHGENTFGYSGVFVYLTDFKVVALLPDAEDKSGSPYIQSIVTSRNPASRAWPPTS